MVAEYILGLLPEVDLLLFVAPGIDKIYFSLDVGKSMKVQSTVTIKQTTNNNNNNKVKHLTSWSW